MKRLPSRLLIALSVLACAWPAAAQQQQNNFQFATPPIPYPYFEPDRTDLKITGSYLGMEADAFELAAGGLKADVRKAINERFAFGGNLGLTLGGGEMRLGGAFGAMDFTLGNFEVGGHLEYQFFNRPGGSLIAFGGLNLPVSVMGFSKVLTVTAGGVTRQITPDSITTVMYGAPFGLQAGIRAGRSWRIAPFVSIVPYLGGVTTLNYETAAPVAGTETEIDVEPFTSTSFGADVIYVPWDLSLGALFQQATSSGKNEDVETVQIQLSWHWRTK